MKFGEGNILFMQSNALQMSAKKTTEQREMFIENNTEAIVKITFSEERTGDRLRCARIQVPTVFQIIQQNPLNRKIRKVGRTA